MQRAILYAFAIFLLMGMPVRATAEAPPPEEMEVLENLKNCPECQEEYRKFRDQLRQKYPNWSPNWDGAVVRSEETSPVPPTVPRSGNTQPSSTTPPPATNKEAAKGAQSKSCATCGKAKSAAPPSPSAKAAEAQGGTAAAKAKKKKKGLGAAGSGLGLLSILLAMAPALKKR